MNNRCNPRIIMVACLFVHLAFGGLSSAQIASAVIREDEELPGGPVGELVLDIHNSAQNSVGGYAFVMTTSGDDKIWGSPDGGPGFVMHTLGSFGNYTQVGFLRSDFGIDNIGATGYSVYSDDISGLLNHLQGVWVDETIIQNELDPIINLPGYFSTEKRATGITSDGQPYWIGGISDSPDRITQNQAIFFGANASVLLMGGDSIVGATDAIQVADDALGSGLRFSKLGTNYILPVKLQSAADTTIVSNGAVVLAGEGPIRKDHPIPAAIGGLPGEKYESFRFVAINESGSYMVSAESNRQPYTADQMIIVNGEIVVREGDTLLSGTPMHAPVDGCINDNGDWLAVTPSKDLILNGRRVFKRYQPVDWNGDGKINSQDENMQMYILDYDSASLSNRDENDCVSIAFVAKAQGDAPARIAGFIMKVTTREPVYPVDSFEVTHGVLSNGALADLADSDDEDVAAVRRNGDLHSRVLMTFTGTSPAMNPAELKISIESSVFSRAQVNQSIDLYNFTNDTWEEVYTGVASRFSDATVTASITDQVWQFVEPFTEKVEARCRYESLNPRQRFAANVDHVFWQIESPN